LHCGHKTKIRILVTKICMIPSLFQHDQSKAVVKQYATGAAGAGIKNA
jgi:hypothetical protein